MKKRGLICSAMSLLLLLPSNSIGISAATVTSDGNVINENGYSIIFDNSAVNGGVDLQTAPEYLETIDKSNVPMTLSDSVVISLPFQTQQNDYYCGPASARMVVGALGYSRTQDQMASLLGTTTNGTNAGNGVANALNSVVAGSKYRFTWQWHTYSDVSKIKGHIVEALNYGNPVMVNTMESPGDVYLAGHNIGTTLYHFGVVADYFNYGNQVTYTDPGYGRYSGFVLDQRASINNLSYAVGGRGYAW